MGTAPGQYGFGRLFNKIRDAVVVADAASGVIVLWNHAAERMFGYTEEEAFGASIEIVIPERFWQTHRDGMATYLQTFHGSLIDSDNPIAISARHKDGHEIPVELTLNPIHQPDLYSPTVMAIIRDVTDRIERERLEQERLALLTEIDRLKTELRKESPAD